MSETIAPMPPTPETVLVEETRAGRYQVEAQAGDSRFMVDQTVALGGLGSGPNPHDLVAAALGACTAMTLRLYAERKGWSLDRVKVQVDHARPTLRSRDSYDRAVIIEGALDEAQKARLIEIANRCPIHLLLERGADVRTTLATASGAFASAAPSGQHIREMAEACAELDASLG